MSIEFDDRWDAYDESLTCLDCGERMQHDVDGDGVMTMGYEYCENCGTKDYGEPVRITEKLIAFGRANGTLPN
jgi:hypothetical protein